jgi:Fe-S oxidoreductase/FAD/FMN-containing dehydrogenase
LKALDDIFGDRICYEENERILHTTDVGILPDVLNMGVIDLLIDRMPEAVVQPNSVEEIQALLQYCNRERIPITPRGAATGGVGGAVPANGGIVVNFSLMDKILDIDKKKMLVTVEPGVIWADLEDELRAQGLMNRTIPSSAPSSTVAGWIASGGVGYGSFEFGPVDDNIESVVLALPDGELREMSGTGLEMVIGCYGSTGIIVKATFRIKKAEEIVPVELGFPTRKEMIIALQELVRDVPMWTCNFETEEYITLKQMSKGEGKESMANSILLGIPRRRYDPEVFEKIANKGRGKIMEHADVAWEGRYLPLRIKKLGPSIVVGEVLVPVRRLDGFFEAMYKKLKNETFGIEGTITNRREAAVRLFVLSDERESFGLNYLGEWAHPITMLKIAKKFSGRTYQTGLYLGGETKSYFGKERLKWIFSFKRVVDPKGILNPGKIVPMYRYALIFGMASHFLGLMKSKKYKAVNPPDKELAYLTDYHAHIQSCIACGYCRKGCPIYDEVKWESSSSKGKMAYAKLLTQLKADIDPYIIKRFYQCTLCGQCKEVCQGELPTCDIWTNFRSKLMEMGYPPMEAYPMMLESIIDHGNPFGEARNKRTEIFPDDAEGLLLPGQEGDADFLLWVGCVNSYNDVNTLPNLMAVLDAAGAKYRVLGEDEGCCGSIVHMSGLPGFTDVANGAVARIQATELDTMATPCAGCANHFREIYPKHDIDVGVRVKHAVEIVDELIRDDKLEFFKPFKKKVAYHDPCELGRHLGIYEPPRRILKSIPGLQYIELPHNRVDAKCCGGGGGLKAVDLDISQDIAFRRVKSAIEAGAQVLVSACPSCKANLRLAADRARKEKVGKIKVMDISEVMKRALGKPPVESTRDDE